MNVIPKLLLGGGFNQFFTIYQPILTDSPRQVESRRSESKEKEDSDKGKLTEKDLFSMLKDLDGLPNEMRALATSLTNTLKMAKLTGSEDLNDLATTYLSSLYKLKEAKYNKEQFKNTYERAVANGNLNEVAIDVSGNILVLNKDLELQFFSPEDWAKVKGSREYSPITNGNLLWMRSHLPSYINQNQYLRIVENGIGLEQVHKMIKDRFHELGNATTSQDFFVPKEVVKGYKLFEEMILNGPEGYYKLTKELSKPEDSLILATLNYIYSTLPTNAKTRLALETDNGTLSEVQEVIGNMILGTIDTIDKISAQYIGSKEKLSESDDKSKDNYATKIAKGYGTFETFEINLGDNNTIVVSGNTMPLAGKNDLILGTMKAVSNLFQSSLGSQLDTRSMSIAGGIVSPYDLNHIISGDDKIRVIDFPYIMDDNGRILPAISSEVREKKKKAEEELKKSGINPFNNDPKYITLNYQAIALAYLTTELPIPYKPDGSLNENSWARFAIISVATDDDVVEDADKSLLRKMNDDLANSVISAIQEADKNYDKNTGWFGNTFYQGTLWIKFNPGFNAAMATLKISSDASKDFDIKDLTLNNQASLTTLQFY